MGYVLSFGVTILAAMLIWGFFMIWRVKTCRDVSAKNAGAGPLRSAGVQIASYGFGVPVVGGLIHRDIAVERRGKMQGDVIFNAAAHFEIVQWDNFSNEGLEYYFDGDAGLLTIAPLGKLPSAVELRIGGKALGSYISAELAANAVALGLTNHPALNGLLSSCKPQSLRDWGKSLPHHFKT